jgi:hypothetical protein
MSSAEDLKQLLQSTIASKTPVKPKDTSERDLASLLSSVDLVTPAKPGLGQTTRLDGNARTAIPAGGQAILPPAPPGQANQATSSLLKDKNDFTTLKYGMEISLRGRFGKYLTAARVQNTEKETDSVAGRHSHATSYVLGVTGQGIGDVLDCLIFVNVEKRDSTGPILYGSAVAIKAPAAMERYERFECYNFN